MKRFTETTKWQDAWFRELPPHMKLFWIYVCDSCDNAGIWNVDFRLASFCIGAELLPDDAQKHLVGKYRPISESRWWIPKFIRFQVGELSEDSRPHQSIVKLLKEHGVYTLWIEYESGRQTIKDKDKTGKGQDGKEGVQGKETSQTIFSALQWPPELNTPRFKEAFYRWIETRMSEFPKPKLGWNKLFQRHIDQCLPWGEEGAIRSVTASTNVPWQGLFEPRYGSGNNGNSKVHEAMDERREKTQLAIKINNHPANHNSRAYRSDPSQILQDELATLQKRFSEVGGTYRNGVATP